MKKPPLTKRKAKWAKNRNVVLRGTKLSYNAAQQERYEKALRGLVNEMTKQTRNAIGRLFRSETAKQYFNEQKTLATVEDASISSQARILMNRLLDKFIQLFGAKALPYAERMVKGAAATSASATHASLKQLSGGLALKTSGVPEGMQEIVKASIAENVSLIKSIPEQYFKDVTGAVMRSITSGQGLADLLPEIQKYDGQTDRRAKNLALDQTRKAYNSINKQKMLAIGVRQFEWIHSGGGQFPRESHIKISGTIFDFDKLEEQQAALGVPPADQGIPGYAINCKCTMKPVIRFEGED